MFGDLFARVDQVHRLVVEQERCQIRMANIAARTSPDARDVTSVELGFQSDRNEMWISSLSVPTPFRSIGLGRQLVQAAENVARQMGVRIINVFPLTSARSFWDKMGYRPHPRTARVVWKRVK